MAARLTALLRSAGATLNAGPAQSQQKPRVVLLGTGWASFRVLRDIDTSKYAVSVVSPRNHLLFTPMLASSAVGTVNQRSICQPVRPEVAHKGARYFESRVSRIDKENKQVFCKAANGNEFSLPYDKLIVGVGCQPNDFGIPGVKEHALFMKETDDAGRFKEHVLQKLEEASYLLLQNTKLSVETEEKIRKALTFVIIGGGPTGVELAGELTDFLLTEGSQQYGHLQKWISVRMFTYDVLGPFDKSIQDYAIKHLQKKQGVEMTLNAFVKRVEESRVYVKTENDPEYAIDYGTLVWCAGIKPHSFISDLDITLDDRGRQILVDERLQVKGEQDIFALGDCATIESHPLPQTAQVAKQQGMFLAKYFNSGLPEEHPSFKFQSLGMMAYLGGYNAVMAQLPGISNIRGFLAFMGWRWVYWGLQLSVRNRYMLSTDWLRTLVFGRDLTRFGPPSSLK
eukprot:CAMPEP_0178405116 /NCGR_PEP_ID=MMETSP0689_2-20121128/18235_1 /TAXON_ID=160604 /ORGANISM="Amphidinium massartii, Strain CS-259" /LENGTH=453 /DNA_ID=CAMNT_0020026125 /DNA_START=65 /DNA_END=1426 /DNA_ORIENTATION=-